MNDDYLWDRTGRDEEVERLEELMRPLALQAPAVRRPRRFAFMGVAAALLVAVLVFALQPPLRTIEFPDVGRVDVEPNSRVRVLRKSADRILLRLDEGTIHASIGGHVKPRLFQVETPVTTCIDLGCHYTLTVDERGASFVRVLTGRVAFVDGDREVYVPAGASCRATREAMGTPVFDDAAPEFHRAVAEFDRARSAKAAAEVARLARREDALSLWHVAVEPAAAEVAVDALIRLVGLPEGATREATLRREAEAVEAWRSHLGWW